jgi:dephospho-CoA kinase
MPVVALTGNIGSGKTTVLKEFARKGVKVLNVDKLVHRYYRDKKSIIYKEIKKNFPQAFTKAGNISRVRLRKIVLSDSAKFKKLNKIVHPQVIADLKTWITQSQKNPGLHIAEVPLLFEKKLDKLFEKIILVKSRQSQSISRGKSGKGLGADQIKGLLAAQGDFKTKVSKSDFIINNQGSLTDLRRRIDLIWRKLG